MRLLGLCRCIGGIFHHHCIEIGAVFAQETVIIMTRIEAKTAVIDIVAVFIVSMDLIGKVIAGIIEAVIGRKDSQGEVGNCFRIPLFLILKCNLYFVMRGRD